MTDASKAQLLYELLKKPEDRSWAELPWYPNTAGECKSKWIQAVKRLGS